MTGARPRPTSTATRRKLDAEGTQAPRKAQGTVGMPPAATGARKRDFGGFSSELEAVLANRMAIAGLPFAEHQFRFCPTRKWRSDFAYPDAMLLVEVDGGTWSGGRHVRGKGFEADCEKTSTAAAMGYRVIRLTRDMVEDGRAVALIRQALEPLAGTDDGREEGP